MPELAIGRQEAFAHGVASLGMSQAEAYRQAGYETSNPNSTYAHASRLVSNGKVQARVTELKAETVKRMAMDRDQIVEAIEGTANEARRDGQPSAAIRGYELLGKAQGMFKDESESLAGLKIELARLSDADLRERLAQALADLGVTPSVSAIEPDTPSQSFNDIIDLAKPIA